MSVVFLEETLRVLASAIIPLTRRTLALTGGTSRTDRRSFYYTLSAQPLGCESENQKPKPKQRTAATTETKNPKGMQVIILHQLNLFVCCRIDYDCNNPHKHTKTCSPVQSLSSSSSSTPSWAMVWCSLLYSAVCLWTARLPHVGPWGPVLYYAVCFVDCPPTPCWAVGSGVVLCRMSVFCPSTPCWAVGSGVVLCRMSVDCTSTPCWAVGSRVCCTMPCVSGLPLYHCSCCCVFPDALLQVWLGSLCLSVWLPIIFCPLFFRRNLAPRPMAYPRHLSVFTELFCPEVKLSFSSSAVQS